MLSSGTGSIHTSLSRVGTRHDELGFRSRSANRRSRAENVELAIQTTTNIKAPALQIDDNIRGQVWLSWRPVSGREVWRPAQNMEWLSRVA